MRLARVGEWGSETPHSRVAWLRLGVPVHEVTEYSGDEARTVLKVYSHVPARSPPPLGRRAP